MLEIDVWRCRFDGFVIFQCIYFLYLSSCSLCIDALLANSLDLFIGLREKLSISQLLFLVSVHFENNIDCLKRSQRAQTNSHHILKSIVAFPYL